MVFHPQNLTKKDGAFIFSSTVCASANPCMSKDIIKELWYNYSCQCSTLEVKEADGFVFTVGNASLPELCGMEYAINIEKDGIAVCAADEKSLIQAYMTLLDMFKPIDRDNDGLKIKLECAQIRERALIDNRMIHFCVFPETELWELQKYLRMCAALKFTHAIVEFWGTLRYDCMKELGWENAYTKEEVRPILNEARELGLEIVPMFNHWGHAAFSREMHGKHVVLDQNISLATYFSENGWRWAIEKDKVKRLLREARNELIELCGEGKYFHVGCDEADGFTYSGEDMDFICDFLNETSAELKGLGRRAIAWGDMLIHRHERYNKGNIYTCHAPTPEKEAYMLSRLDKNIIIADWQYDAVIPPVETSITLKNAGFDVLLSPRDKSERVIDVCVDTIKSESLFGFMLTTWHRLSLRTRQIPYIASGAYEDLEERKEDKSDYSAYVMRRSFNANGVYEKAGRAKKQTDDIT